MILVDVIAGQEDRCLCRRDARSASRFITALYKAHLFMEDVPTRLETTR
jgi:hypothetical protein